MTAFVHKDIAIKMKFITKTRLFKYTENFTTKNWIFSDKNSDIFHISDQNIDCGYSLEPPRRGGSNEYPQFMFLSRNKKNNVYPCKPQFYYIKVGLKGSKLYRQVFVMAIVQNTWWADWYARKVLFCSYFLIEHMFLIIVSILSNI